MELNELRAMIKGRYDTFFTDLSIDPTTGIIEGSNKRFNGYPYIGANYCNAPVKVLFIALDCGEDELAKQNTFRSFESRESIFGGEKLSVNNPHIAGLYSTALYLLKDSMGWEPAWEKLWSKNRFTMLRAIKKVQNDLPKNLMSYVAYFNRYSFVTVGRKKRVGGEDRCWIQPEKEKELIFDIACLFEPDIIVFQGTQGIDNCSVRRLKDKFKVYKMYHPSCWQRRANKLQYVVTTINKLEYNQ